VALNLNRDNSTLHSQPEEAPYLGDKVRRWLSKNLVRLFTSEHQTHPFVLRLCPSLISSMKEAMAMFWAHYITFSSLYWTFDPLILSSVTGR